MAKKQQIILTHGTGVPQYKDVKLGEVLVRHAEDTKEAALYTPNNTENAFVEFPSKDWVSNEITQVNTAASQLGATVTALQTQVDGIDAAYKAADATLKSGYETADAALETAYKQAVADLKTELEGADATLGGEIEALAGRVDTAESEIDALQAADTEIRGELTTAETNIRKDFAAADATLKSELNTEIAKKADNTTVSALADRVTTAESDIDALEAADTAMDAAYKAADAQIRLDYAAADAALKSELNTEIAKKADSTTVEALAGRVTTAESDIDALEAADTAMDAAYKAADAQIRLDYAAADATLKSELNTEIAKKANSTDLSALADRVGAIEGEDANTSMREVAAEEAAKEVAKVVANADEDFDTLKEVADWILSDTTGAAALQTDVAALKEVTEGYEGKGAIKAAVDTIEGRVTVNEGAIADLQAADTAMETAYKAADDAVIAAYKAADTALETKLNAEIAKKASNDTVTTLTGRVDTAEDEIDALQAADIAMEAAYKAADDAVIAAYKAADTALETKLNAEIAKKASNDTVTSIDGRLTNVEGAYVKQVKVTLADGTVKTFTPVNNVLDLSEMIIDGGTY